MKKRDQLDWTEIFEIQSYEYYWRQVAGEVRLVYEAFSGGWYTNNVDLQTTLEIWVMKNK